jgi:isopenicillin-N N-acyltransferase-like protein
MFELDTVSVRGNPRDLGRAQGEAFRDRIHAYTAQRIDAFEVYAAERGRKRARAEFLEAGARCLAVHSKWHPEGAEEHEGIAEGARIDAALLYATTNMTDVRDVLLLPAPAATDDGCTALLVPPNLSQNAEIIAGQTWDLNPSDLEFVVGVHRLPSDGPETWSVTCAGALSLVGMNEFGLAVGTTNVKTARSRPGVGYIGVLHRALGQRSVEAASEVVRGAPRAAAHTYWVADETSAREFECDPDDVVERPLGERALARTNHCMAKTLVAREGEPKTASSARRLSRAETALALGAVDVARIRALFADRSDGVDSINRYPEDEQGTATNACLIAVPKARELWACRGPADRGVWHKLEFERKGSALRP